MTATKDKPWAFDNNPSYDRWRKAFYDADLVLENIASGRFDDYNTRGDNMRTFAVYGHAGDHGRALLGSLMVRGNGPNGITIYVCQETCEINAEAQMFAKLAEAKAA